MNTSKTAVVISKITSILQFVAGSFLLICYIVCLIMYLTDEDFKIKAEGEFWIYVLFLGVPGVMLIIFSIKKKRLINEFKKYFPVLLIDPEYSISNLAASVGEPENIVKKNLLLMIKRKYFINACINQKTNCLVFGNMSSEDSSESEINVNQQHEYVFYTCKSCGATNKVIKGQQAVCEFCGNVINFK